MRKLVLIITLVCSLALLLLAAMPVGAQQLDPNSPPPARDYVSCGHFETQADAQEVLDSGNLDDLGRQSLDGDGDGIACEDALLDPNSPPPANDHVSCGHFETQESAQETLDSGLLNETERESLDGDGDGIACEVRWGEPGGEGAASTPDTGGRTMGAVQLPNTGAGDTETPTNGSALAAGMVMISGVALFLSRRLMTR